MLGYIQSGVDEGARLVCGGGRPAHLDKGYFVEPTLFADVDNSMRIAREEIFGPVLVLIPFHDDDDAVRIANDSEYGLSGGVTSASEERALAVARRIRSGTVSVNGGIYYGAASPFGGYKASGARSPERQRGVRAVPGDQDHRGWPVTAAAEHDDVIASGEHLLQQLRIRDVEHPDADLAIEMDIHDRVTNPRGALQGGLVATLIDVVAGRAVVDEGPRRRWPRPT